MIKTIEINPDILATALATHIFNEFGTVRGKDDGDYLCVTELDDLVRIIKEYLNR